MLGIEHDSLSDILQLGPSALEAIGKKMKNPFWKEVFCSAKPTLEGAIFCHPEKLLMSPFWNNTLIKRNNRAIKPTAFPDISSVVTTVGDFYKLGEYMWYNIPKFTYQSKILLNFKRDLPQN